MAQSTVVRHAQRQRALLGQPAEGEHPLAARLDPSDLFGDLVAAACGVAAQRLVPLPEAEADVVESGQDVGERFVEIGQLGLELADALAALAGQRRGVGPVVGDRIGDEAADGPVFAFGVAVVQGSVVRRDDLQHLAQGVSAGCDHLAADMLRDFADVLHHGRHVDEDRAVFALQDIVRSVRLGPHDERVVDESVAQRPDGGDPARQPETAGYFMQDVFVHFTRFSVCS